MSTHTSRRPLIYSTRTRTKARVVNYAQLSFDLRTSPSRRRSSPSAQCRHHHRALHLRPNRCCRSWPRSPTTRMTARPRWTPSPSGSSSWAAPAAVPRSKSSRDRHANRFRPPVRSSRRVTRPAGRRPRPRRQFQIQSRPRQRPTANVRLIPLHASVFSSFLPSRGSTSIRPRPSVRPTPTVRVSSAVYCSVFL